MAVPEKDNEVQQKEGTKYSDPTHNVLQLVEAAVKRLDDLSEIRYGCVRETEALNKEIFTLHITYGEKLAKAESDRINAIRAVDVGAGALANERANGQAALLANQLTASVEMLRSQAINPLMDRVTLLEKSQNVGTGKSSGVKELIAYAVAAIAITGFIIDKISK